MSQRHSPAPCLPPRTGDRHLDPCLRAPCGPHGLCVPRPPARQQLTQRRAAAGHLPASSSSAHILEATVEERDYECHCAPGWQSGEGDDATPCAVRTSRSQATEEEE